MNHVTLIGRLGDEPTIRYTGAGEPVTSFSLATSKKWKDKTTGEKKEFTEWHKCVAFGRIAEVCEQFLNKGSLVGLNGELMTKPYDKEIGGETIKIYPTSIKVNNLEMLGSKGDSDNAGDEGSKKGW